MKYEITVMVDEKGKPLPRKVVTIESETLLTAKDVKAKCLAEAAVDTTKLTVKLEELWTGNGWKDKAAADDLVLTERNSLLDYYLSLTPVEVTVAPAAPVAPEKPVKAKKAKAAEPAPAETPAVEPVVETVETPVEPVVETPTADAAPEETK